MIDKNTKKKNSTKLFFSGVLVLTITNLLVKVIGLMFKIPMNRIIGDEGMGYYNSAYTFYTYLYMVSTAGLPTAISIMISDSRANRQIKQVKRIYHISLLLFIAIGVVSTMIMFFGSGIMSTAIGAEPTKYSIMAIAPTLLFICICSALRGYFQGYQQMTPTAISQFLEAACKLGIGIAFALFAKNQGYGIHIQAAYATVGLTTGALAGMLCMVIAKMFFKEKQYDAQFLEDKGENNEVARTGELIKKLILIALPITISASVMSLTNLIDTAIVQRLLQSTGLSQVAATELYGNYTSLAVPMFNLPPVLIYPISYSIVPLLTAAKKRGDTEKCRIVTESSLRVAMLVGIPCGLGLAALSEPILSLLFKESSVQLAYPLLTLLAPSTAFICILSVSNAILQSAGFERKPLISMLAGAAVKIVTNFVLIQYIGMKSTPISTFLCYLTVTLLNLYFIKKHVGIMPKLSGLFGKPLLSGVACALCAYFSYALLSSFISGKIAVFVAIIAAVLVYAIVIFLVRGISGDDVRLLPKGAAIYRILNKLKLVK
ncbi:MAG: polysaccharide biosynthesis protein [Ruminococcaceae bacterium]|nr:polysaccharide biosynthesis protein [Oscillospiraceae bacterium]